MKKLLRRTSTLKFVSALLAGYAWVLYKTARIRVITPIPTVFTQGPVVMATWHQHITMLPAMGKPSPAKLLALMSGSRDGTFIRLIAARLGIGASIGSSHRSAVSGARGLIQAARTGHTLFITPDGPRGPACVAKPGATEIARLTRLPLIPCAAWCSHGKTFSSWDSLRLPYPFSTITVAYGEPLQTLTPQALQHALNSLTTQAKAGSGPLASNPSTP
ncbi:MAG: DUF374 domain-containing protein [Alphaproteobacteria bacterium]|nr:MAG: DUF374 domain-containing protein [Alphaproteobacteria bacterium]